MEKILFLASILLLNTCFISLVHCGYYSKSQPLKPVQEKKTHLHFYIHDILSGKNPTAIPIAHANTTKNLGPVPFGTTVAIDDPLTEGPEITSKLIGNARGMYLSSSQGNDLTLLMCVDLAFTTGRFNGSSLSVFSRNPITESHREMAVVGGRGKFRFARGFVKVKTHYLNVFNGDAVLEYDVEVVHP